MKKRGQITVFIILGLLIVLSVSIYTYVMHGNAKTALDSNVESVRFSAQIQPIRYFVSSCLELVTIDAIKKLGKGGGFIKPQYNSLGNPWVTEGAYFTFLYQRKSYRETSSSNPDVDLIGDGTFPNVVSGPNNWDYQLTEYITEDDSRRIRECLDEFVFFKNRGFEIETEEISIDLKINDDTVVTDMKYPIDIKLSGQEAEISEFSFVYPVKLFEIRRLAVEAIEGVVECENVMYEEFKTLIEHCGKGETDDDRIHEACKTDESIGRVMGTLGTSITGYANDAINNIASGLPGMDPDDFELLQDVYESLYNAACFNSSGNLVPTNSYTTPDAPTDIKSCSAHEVLDSYIPTGGDYEYDSIFDSGTLEYYTYGYNNSNWTMYAKFCKKFCSLLGCKTMCKIKREDTSSEYTFLHILVDRARKTEPFSFLFATRRNYDVVLDDLPREEVNC